MVILGGWAFSYERGTPVQEHKHALGTSHRLQAVRYTTGVIVVYLSILVDI